MNCPCNQFLTRPGLSIKEDSGICPGDFMDKLPDLSYLRALSHYSCARGEEQARPVLRLEESGYGLFEFYVIDGFCYEIERSQLHGLDCIMDAGIAAEDDDAHCSVDFLKPPQNLYTVHVREKEVKDNRVGPFRFEHPHGRASAAGGEDRVTVA